LLKKTFFVPRCSIISCYVAEPKKFAITKTNDMFKPYLYY